MMGRTIEVLAGRLRKAAGADPAPAARRSLPTAPPPEPELADDGPVLVPLTTDDLPGDRDSVPHVEVGGPRAKAAVGPQLVRPRPAVAPPAPQVVFQLVPESVRPSAPP